jgi:hypothetical protein
VCFVLYKDTYARRLYFRAIVFLSLNNFDWCGGTVSGSFSLTHCFLQSLVSPSSYCTKLLQGISFNIVGLMAISPNIRAKISLIEHVYFKVQHFSLLLMFTEKVCSDFLATFCFCLYHIKHSKMKHHGFEQIKETWHKEYSWQIFCSNTCIRNHGPYE